ncbi:hypothetical protein Tco_0638131 [Tanacetum coccineum]
MIKIADLPSEQLDTCGHQNVIINPLLLHQDLLFREAVVLFLFFSNQNQSFSFSRRLCSFHLQSPTWSFPDVLFTSFLLNFNLSALGSSGTSSSSIQLLSWPELFNCFLFN